MNNTITQIISDLRNGLKPFVEIQDLPSNPGIYAVGFIGNIFPFPSGEHIINNGDIVYVGKTAISQRNRTAKTHFNSGKTGSSTLRRSLGAILRKDLNLKPIPRSYTESRMRDYKFIEQSEEILTEWMVNNLSLSFYGFNKGNRILRKLEKDILERLSPVLNIQGNSHLNPYTSMLRELRAKCKEIAKTQMS